jgi:hypothetical protein
MASRPDSARALPAPAALSGRAYAYATAWRFS